MTGITIKDYGPPEPPPEGEKWTTEELQRDFEVEGFAFGYVVVRRKADNVRGSLQFTHSPRVYFGFVEYSGRR